jgi:hypothetical protein
MRGAVAVDRIPKLAGLQLPRACSSNRAVQLRTERHSPRGRHQLEGRAGFGDRDDGFQGRREGRRSMDLTKRGRAGPAEASAVGPFGSSFPAGGMTSAWPSV